MAFMDDNNSNSNNNNNNNNNANDKMSIKTKKQVSFDETCNQTREFPRVPMEEKTNVWLTKLEIARFRKEAAAEVMILQVRGLVQNKLLESMVELDFGNANHQGEGDWILQAKELLEQKLELIMQLPHDQILAFLEAPSSKLPLSPTSPTSSSPRMVKDEPFFVLEEDPGTSNSTSSTTRSGAHLFPTTTWGRLSGQQAPAPAPGMEHISMSAAPTKKQKQEESPNVDSPTEMQDINNNSNTHSDVDAEEEFLSNFLSDDKEEHEKICF
jgi:hypothetical protein